VAWRLGLTSFGGPIAHIGHFRAEYVVRREWLDEQEFAELVAVTSLLPGPSSSQLGIAIGARRAGRLGGIAAWLGFTLPSALAMTALALVVGESDVGDAGWIEGLELVAVPVVALAVLAMRRTLAPDTPRLALAAAGAALALGGGGFAGQAVALAVGAIVGVLAFTPSLPEHAPMPRLGRRSILALGCLAALVALLVGLPVLRDATGSQAVALVDAMFRSGSLVFGGGHVVLPLLDQAVVEPGWVGEKQFLAGYGLVQAMPGPLFTFSAYLGAIQEPEPNGLAGASLALGAIYLPSFLLLGGILPLWSVVRRSSVVQAALVGVGAAVVGLLAAALWDPVLSTSIDGVGDLAFALALLILLRFVPIWVVVPLAAAAGSLLL
jgi:chromate transporter